MHGLSDLLLRKPMSDAWLLSLLFGVFILHILFVLFTLGTGILSVYYFLRTRLRGASDQSRWHKDFLRTFMVHKSLTVVLGIGPLLLMQVGFTVPFFTAVSLLAPYWLLVIILMGTAFLLLETLGHYDGTNRHVHLTLAIVGVACLLAIPATFVAVLALTENPGQWLPTALGGHRLTHDLSLHWMLRYLHVLGAAVVFGGAFHYLASKQDETEKRQSLLRWVVGGLLYQVLIGVMLYATMPRKFDAAENVALFIGVLAAVALLWLLYNRRVLDRRVTPWFAGVLLVFMLLTRQLHQYSGIMPVQREITRAATRYESRLQPYEHAALERYKRKLRTVYDNGETVYSGSCAFCHGEDGHGKGSDAHELKIPPADFTVVRSTRPYLTKMLSQGVPGTAMPYFYIFTTDKLASVVDTLDHRFGVLSPPKRMSQRVPKQAQQQATQLFSTTCAACHGQSGNGQTPVGRGLYPAPPDLTQYTLSPEGAFDVITNGYRGTGMPSFGKLTVDMRWGLVEIVQSLYKGADAPTAGAPQ